MRTPLLLLLICGCFGTPITDPAVAERDAGFEIPDGGVGDCGDSWVLSYRINGTFHITHTTGGLGDDTRPISEGLLRLRVPDKSGGPGDGTVRLISFNHGERFEITAFGIRTNTDVDVQGGPHPCGLAVGERDESSVVWDRCTPSDTQGIDKNSWTPDDPAEGPGCLNGYTTRGEVICSGPLCDMAGLVEGSNPQAEDYAQPLNPFVFVDGWDAFSMEAVEVPNRTPNRTWFDLSGVLVEQVKDNTPMCICGA